MAGDAKLQFLKECIALNDEQDEECTASSNGELPAEKGCKEIWLEKFDKISVKLRLLGTQRQSKEDAKNSEHFCKEAPSRSECLAVVGAGELGVARRRHT